MDEPTIPASLKKEATDFTQILIAVFVIVLTLVIFALYERRKNARKGVLLTGLSDAGKTLLYARLKYQRFVQTQTSIDKNIGDYLINNSSLRLVDVPGHERLRYKYFEEYKAIACAVIYVVDSVTIQKDVRDVAEFLYNILTDRVVLSNCPQLIVACNKQDLPLAKGCNAIKSILEKELNTLRITKSSQLDSVDPKSKKASFLGEKNKDFEFSSLPLKVEFVETNLSSAEQNESINIDDLQKLLIKIV